MILGTARSPYNVLLVWASPMANDWILETGNWDDAGFWRDDAFWID